jgi:triacylglycerol lipase
MLRPANLVILIAALNLPTIPRAPAGPATPSRHVILVPGIHDSARTLRKLERSLTEAGFHPHLATFSPNNGSLPLEASARQIQTKIDAFLPPGARYSLVAFSMGGLVARYYVQRLADPTRIDTFLTIATPHHGTWLARFGFHRGVREMIPGSPFLRDLDSDAASFASIRWVTIRTPLDLMIIPSRSSKLPWAENHTYPVLIHPLLVWDNRVIRRTIESLNERPRSIAVPKGRQSAPAGAARIPP